MLLSSGLLAEPARRNDRILVKFKPDAAPAGEARPRGQVIRRFPALGIEVIQLDGTASFDQVLAEYRADARVVYAEPDRIRKKHAVVPNDPGTPEGDAWHLKNDGRKLGKIGADISAQAAWDIRHDAPNVVVAVLDTGIRYTHEDLAANMWRNPGEIAANGIDDDGNGYVDDVFGCNTVNNTGEPMDDEGHGTFVAGLIGAVGNNGKGVAGVCWKVQLMAVKVLNASGGGSDSDIIAGLEYARQKGAQIINASLGAIGGPSLPLSDAVDALAQSGVILVVAAGNSTIDNDFDAQVTAYPASYPQPNVVSVAASTRNDLLSTFSNYGFRSVDLAAPGVDVPSTSLESDTAYDAGSGTSYSAPLVAGALALVKSHLPQGSHYSEAIRRVLRSCDPVPSLSGKCVTAGRLNVARALSGAPPAVPVNDAFGRALPLGSDTSFAGSGLAAGAGVQSGEPDVWNSAASLWWHWTAPFTGTVVTEALLDGVGSATVRVYQGDTLAGLTSVNESANTFFAIAGQRYFIKAQADRTTIGWALTLRGRYELAPADFTGYTLLFLKAHGPGSIVPAKLLGTSLQRRDRPITLKSRPAPGYLLWAWVDAQEEDEEASVLSREPTFVFTPDRAFAAIYAVFAPNPFPELKGRYNGLATTEDSSAEPAFFTLDLSAGGAFTASVRLAGQTYRFKGTLRSDMHFTGTFGTARGPVTVDFTLDDERRITGTVQHSGGVERQLIAESGGFSATENPAIAAGIYSLQLNVANSAPGVPAREGNGVVVVSTAGNIRFVGTLGDGRPVSQGAVLYRTSYWPLYATPYPTGGSIAGLVAFDTAQADADCTGTLRWRKAPAPKDRQFAQGFTATVDLVGQRTGAAP